MYRELFYLISSFVKRFKTVREPEFSTFVFISILITFNIMTVFTFLGYFFDVNLYRDYNFDYAYIYALLGVFIMVLNYITIYSNEKK
jgi:multisubunit Na+/H+ antiporter MnhF subunit